MEETKEKWENLFEALAYPDPLNRPKHQRLTDVLVEGIKRGLWSTGDRLPAEDELTELTPYSLGTVQRAMRNLAEQGLVQRHHGLGTFVAKPLRALRDPWHCRFLASDGETILPVYSHAEAREKVEGQGPWTHYLGHDADVMRLDRIINVNEEFNVYSRFYCDCRTTSGLWEVPLDTLHGANFKKLIMEDCKLPITEITHLIKMIELDSELAGKLSLPVKSSAILLQAIAMAGKGRTIYFQEFVFGPTRYLLRIPESTGA